MRRVPLSADLGEEELHNAQVASLAIDLGGLRASHWVCATIGRFQANAFNLAMHQSGILSG